MRVTDLPPAPKRSLEQVAAELRLQLTLVLHAVAGQPARPVRLMREAGLDKSLASRLVTATKAHSDQEFLHRVPSPMGLRILQEAARPLVAADLLQALQRAVDQFQDLINAFPGGRQALDAQLGASSGDIRARREQIARQASFKAVSFLFGHYSETLSTTLFIVPGATGDYTDMIEVHRRIGLHRLVPGTAMPLLSLHTQAPSTRADSGPQMTSITGDAQTQAASDFLMAEASGTPLPALRVEREGPNITFILPEEPGVDLPTHLTTAFRITQVHRIERGEGAHSLRTYMLNTPCHRLVRDVYLAEGLWPQAQPQVGFYLPGPSGSNLPEPDPDQAHHRRLNLSVSVNALPNGPQGMALAGVPDHVQAMQAVLARAGLAEHKFRGWRCEMSYPVPLIEMQLALAKP